MQYAVLIDMRFYHSENNDAKNPQSDEDAGRTRDIME